MPAGHRLRVTQPANPGPPKEAMLIVAGDIEAWGQWIKERKEWSLNGNLILNVAVGINVRNLHAGQIKQG